MASTYITEVLNMSKQTMKLVAFLAVFCMLFAVTTIVAFAAGEDAEILGGQPRRAGEHAWKMGSDEVTLLEGILDGGCGVSGGASDDWEDGEMEDEADYWASLLEDDESEDEADASDETDPEDAADEEEDEFLDEEDDSLEFLTVRITTDAGPEVYEGDTITLFAHVEEDIEGLNWTSQWFYNDGDGWVAVASNTMKHSFVLDDENCYWEWKVVIAIIPDEAV